MAAGRKPKWKELDMDNKLTLIEGWARNGATDKEIYEKLGISHDLYYRWKREKPEFYEAQKAGREIADLEVEAASFKAATGYEYTEVKEIEGADGKKRIEETTKYYPPNPTMAIFWLKNRRPEDWRDKSNIHIEGATWAELVKKATDGDDN